MVTSLPLSRVIVLTAHDIPPPPPRWNWYWLASFAAFAPFVQLFF